MLDRILIVGAVVTGLRCLDGWKLQHDRALYCRAFQHLVLAVERQRLQRRAFCGRPSLFLIALLLLRVLHFFAREHDICNHGITPFTSRIRQFISRSARPRSPLLPPLPGTGTTRIAP